MSKRITTESFVKRAMKIHGELYSYNKTIYKNTKSKVTITCSLHGDFLQRPDAHLEGRGCKQCGAIASGKTKAHSFDTFINKASEVHFNKFDYSKTDYVNNTTKVTIICPTHGEFIQTPSSHLFGKGCKKCANEGFGWKDIDWYNAGKNSNFFDSFKVYVIKCFNEEEEFIKIGKTFNTIGRRFNSKTDMPYQWELLKVYEGDYKTMSILEREFLSLIKDYSYSPTIEFKGITECCKLSVLDLLIRTEVFTID